MEKHFLLTTAVAIQVFTEYLSPSPLSTHHRINQDDDLTLHPFLADTSPCILADTTIILYSIKSDTQLSTKYNNELIKYGPSNYVYLQMVPSVLRSCLMG